MSPIYFIVLGGLVIAGVVSLRRGGPWEQGVAALLIAAWVASSLAPFDWIHPPWIVIGIDAAVFLVLLYGAIFSHRRWMTPAAAFQFLVMATHLVFAQNRALEQWAYVSAYYVWNAGVVLALSAGVIWRDPARRRTSVRRKRPSADGR